MDALDLSYYAAGESLQTVDIAIGSGDIVTIDELPDDPQELVAFLQGENCEPRHWVLVAQAYVAARRGDAALQITGLGLGVFLDAAAQEPLHATAGWTHLLLAKGLDKALHLEQAESHFAAVDPQSTGALLALAQIAAARDHAEQALQTYNALLKKDPNNCLALMGKAQIALAKTRNYAAALKTYQQVLALNPLLRPDPRIGVGVCFWCLKDKPMALAAWNRALQLDPANTRARTLLALALLDHVFTESLLDELFLAGYEKALAEIVSLLQQSPNDPVVLLALCLYYFSRQKYDLVEKIVAHIVASSAKSPFTSKVLSTALFWLGRVAFAKEDYTQAQKCFHEAIRLNDTSLAAKVGLGQAQLARNLTEEAMITFELILKNHPKCLEANYILGMVHAKSSSRQKKEQATLLLERYVRLCQADPDRKEPVEVSAYLTLSTLYESRDLTQALTYLGKAVDACTQIGRQAPVEVYNNIAVFNFTKTPEESLRNFDLASEQLANIADPDLRKNINLTISFNKARTSEATDPEAAVKAYNAILQECPGYFSAKLRLLFLDAVSPSPKAGIAEEIKALLADHALNLEIRSFYGWFIKTFGKKAGIPADAESAHQKETLVEHDSHDLYALVSLANVYCTMAKDLKGKDKEKRKKYYLRAIELFSKVLLLDPRNVFAAQGFAIVYIENKEYDKGLDILRKIRDSLNDISVYLNLGHVLVEMKQYSKAIENYEIALVRYTNSLDPKVLQFLGRAWCLRGLAEKNVSCLKKALEYSQDALAKTTGSKSAASFNVAFVQFQIAELVTKQPMGDRNLDDILDAIVNLNEAIQSLNAMAEDESAHTPYPKPELKARANLGTTTLLNRLNVCLAETKEHLTQIDTRLAEAKRLREEEEARKAREAEEALALEKAKLEAMAAERQKLQEQAQQWAEESRLSATIVEDDSDSEKRPKKKGKKGKKKEEDFIDDDEPSDAGEGDDFEGGEAKDESDAEAPKAAKNGKAEKGKAKKTKRRRRGAAIEDEDDDEESAKKKFKPEEESSKKKFKSDEMVHDSDDEDDDLF